MSPKTFLPFLLILGIIAAPEAFGQESKPSKAKVVKQEISFKSQDGLVLVADLYTANHGKKAPFILLCHQANWSRGEYQEIAPKLVKMGFNCLALDQRSGNKVNGVLNQSTLNARAKKLPTSYIHARQDIVAAAKYVRSNYAHGKLLLWGSSYSSALVLEIVGQDSSLADGVLSFAPGEYFGRLGKSQTFVRDGAKKLKVPVFLTGSKVETANSVKKIADVMKLGDKLHFFKPKTRGNHGSRALWEKFSDSGAYWKSLEAFLDKHFPRARATSRPAKK